jgi:hypothetical protein
MTDKLPKPTSVFLFYSYSHKDEAFERCKVVWLMVVPEGQRPGVISAWANGPCSRFN